MIGEVEMPTQLVTLTTKEFATLMHTDPITIRRRLRKVITNHPKGKKWVITIAEK